LDREFHLDIIQSPLTALQSIQNGSIKKISGFVSFRDTIAENKLTELTTNVMVFLPSKSK
jgi:hypothetical protein